MAVFFHATVQPFHSDTFALVAMPVITAPTIVALSTPIGVGALGVIRLSGSEAVDIVDKIFRGKKLAEQVSHTLHFGRIVDGEELIDEVVVSLFHGPHSYTGEDVVEISCHGSTYIQQRIIELCIANGAYPAKAGEFTQRAFLSGKLDLTQAEAVGDLIAAESKAAQQTAMHQLRGGFSAELKAMREELITFSALIELEIDFSQEDVEFADRGQLYALVERIEASTRKLIDSFRLGNAVKNGVSVAIIGAPNAGKSTLLNALLNEERAIVSEIAGTTRDTIEEVMNIDGILYRFIDTAGIREETSDVIEQMGIERSRKKAEEADIILYLHDATNPDTAGLAAQLTWLESLGKPFVLLLTKADLSPDMEAEEALPISAKSGEGLEALKERLSAFINAQAIQPGNTIITNTRHLAALQRVAAAVTDIKTSLDSGISGDLIALDIRQALHFIGEITGQVIHDRDILGAIFGKFCIGK
jgi:tRNA modification GTPase